MLHELSNRSSNAVTVRLLWDSETTEVTIEVVSPVEMFTLRPPRDKVLDWYHHPFAHANTVPVVPLAWEEVEI